MINKITTFSKLLFAGAAVVLFSFSASAQNLMQENNVQTEATAQQFEASAGTEPKSMLSVDEVRATEYAAAPVDVAPVAKASKKAVKMNPIKTAIAVAKIAKAMKKAELKQPLKENKVKGGGGLSSNMKLGILLAAIGLIVAIIGGYVSGILGAIGVIILIVGLVLIIIELVNNM